MTLRTEVFTLFPEIIDDSTTIRFDNAMQAVGKTFERILDIADKTENGEK